MRTDRRDPGSVPPEVASLVADWRARGQPAQQAIDWPRERWTVALPAYAEVFDGLPTRLDRATVRRAVTAGLAAGDSIGAFLSTMAWGFGQVGYGPYRVEKMLTSRADTVGAVLEEAASLAARGRPLDAYRQLAGAGRIAGLGPAFGTKFLYFASGGPERALILDRIVASCLARVAALLLNPVRWDAQTYRSYVTTMGQWARELDVAPDHVEQVLFTAEALRSGSQWGEE
jgi:hypothetical protein